MQHLVFELESIADLTRELCELVHLQEHASILVQILSTHREQSWYSDIYRELHEYLPLATVVGCCTPGVMSQGSFRDKHTVVSLLVFDSTRIDAQITPMSDGQEEIESQQLALKMQTKDDLKGVLLFATAENVRVDIVLQKLVAAIGKTPIFGGVAGDLFGGIDTWVFLNGEFSDQGIVTLMLLGADLRIITSNYLGWMPFGEVMEITSANENRVASINHCLPFEIYQDYIGSDRDCFFSTATEFPLILQRGDLQIARVPLMLDELDRLVFMADIHEGEKFQFGFGDINWIVASHSKNYRMMSHFQPEAVCIYACISRQHFLQDDYDVDISPFLTMTTMAGAFTFGEFDTANSGDNLLNATIVSVCLSEKPIDPSVRQVPTPSPELEKRSSKHLERLRRLMHFISRVTGELQSANRELEQLALHDGLTGIFNRHSFDESLGQEIERAQSHGLNMSLMMVDIDHFKKVNDRFGHLVGDNVLVEVAAIIGKQIRAVDLLARYGGEEFILLLPGTGLDEASHLAERIRQSVEQKTAMHDPREQPAVTCSIGIATLNLETDTDDSLVSRADKALYKAKESGRNRVVKSAG